MSARRDANEHAVFILAYLRASTDDQNARRARGRERTQGSCVIHGECHRSKVDRTALSRLIDDARYGSVLPSGADRPLAPASACPPGGRLKSVIQNADLRVVPLDLPTP